MKSQNNDHSKSNNAIPQSSKDTHLSQSMTETLNGSLRHGMPNDPVIDISEITQPKISGSRDNRVNQDGVFAWSSNNLQVLLAVDGVGSSAQSQLATQILINTIRDNVDLPPLDDSYDLHAKYIFDEAKKKISAHKDLSGMGCCFILCLIFNGIAYTYQCGDCKSVIIRDNKVVFESKDEHVAQKYYDINIDVINQLEALGLQPHDEDIVCNLHVFDENKGDYILGKFASLSHLVRYINSQGKLNPPVDEQKVTTFNELKNALKRYSESLYSGRNIIFNFLGQQTTTFENVIKYPPMPIDHNDLIILMSDGLSDNFSPDQLVKLTNTHDSSFKNTSRIMNALENQRKTNHQYKNDDISVICYRALPPLNQDNHSVLEYFLNETTNPPSIEQLSSMSNPELQKLAICLIHNYREQPDIASHIYSQLLKLLPIRDSENPNQLIESPYIPFCSRLFAELSAVEGDYCWTDSLISALNKGLNLQWESFHEITASDDIEYKIQTFNPNTKTFTAYSREHLYHFEFDPVNQSVSLMGKMNRAISDSITSFKFYSDQKCTDLLSTQEDGLIPLITKTRFYCLVDGASVQLQWASTDESFNGTNYRNKIVATNNSHPINILIHPSDFQKKELTDLSKILLPAVVVKRTCNNDLIAIPPLVKTLMKECVRSMMPENMAKVIIHMISTGDYVAATDMTLFMCRKTLISSHAANARQDDIIEHSIDLSSIELIVEKLLENGLTESAKKICSASREIGTTEKMSAFSAKLFTEFSGHVGDLSFFRKSAEHCKNYSQNVLHHNPDQTETFVSNECKVDSPRGAL